MADPGEKILFPADGGRVSPAAVRRFQLVISRFPCYGGYPADNRPVRGPGWTIPSSSAACS